MEKKAVAGGGGAGAGIGGNGGTGGNGNDNVITQGSSGYSTAFHGEEGENCGKVNIYNTLTVCAYGGAGGAGGVSSASSGGGGGGYPAAGIGGGGAGGGAGDHISGGGGYTGGNEQTALIKPHNGMAGSLSVEEGEIPEDIGPGGGYFEKADNTGRLRGEEEFWGGLLGGGGGWTSSRAWGYTYGGDGGIAGKGGTVKVSSVATIKAFNGNKFTDGTSYNEGENAVEIYAQKGQLLKIEKTLGWWTDTMNEYYSKFLNTEINYTSCWSRNQNEKVTLREEGICEVLSYGQGIGSGAGYIELSNGTYTIDSSLN